MYDVIILGGGPAGITAAIYCARSNLSVCLIDKHLIGGNPLNYLEIENYPGLPGTTEDLIDKFIEHLDMYDNIEKIEFAETNHIDLYNKKIEFYNKTIEGKKIIIATGSRPRMLHVPGEKEFFGKGVHYCAICDGPLYKGKQVAVIGGGNAACEEALGLSKICENVHIIEFTDKLNADKITVDKIYNTPNIAVSLSTQVLEIKGVDKVDSIDIQSVKNPNTLCTINVDAVFPYIGMSPNLPTEELPVACLDGSEYIRVDENMQTIMPDVYAIGDITSKKYRQVITAMSDGAIAAIHISKNI